MFDLEKFKSGKYYVHLPTQEYFSEVMEYLDKNNIKWINGDSLKDEVDNTWNINASSTCIDYEKNDNSEGVVLGNFSFYKKHGYLDLNKAIDGVAEELERLDTSVKGVEDNADKSEKDVSDDFNNNIEFKKGDIDMNEKMKRDLVKLLFEKEFYEHEQEEMYIYKGRIIMNYMHRTKGFIDFIEMINENYNINGKEVTKIIIEEFDLKEYKG